MKKIEKTNDIVEKWTTINGYGQYQVSNLGKVRSLPREKYSKGGTTYIAKERILKKQIVGKGYHQVRLFNGQSSGNGDLKYVHRLVAEHFCECEDMEGLQVHHLDEDKLNNCYTNLVWTTPKEHFRKYHIENRGRKLNESDVLQIRHFLELGLSQEKIANIFDISQSMVSSIKRNEQWADIQTTDDCQVSSASKLREKVNGSVG